LYFEKSPKGIRLTEIMWNRIRTGGGRWFMTVGDFG